MSEIKELQDDEREALQSIYEGDIAFKQITEKSYSYKYGEDDDIKSFLLELTWGDNYPNDPPSINMDTFYNRNIVQSVKSKIQSVVDEEAQQWLGCGMTYTLFECLKEQLTELLDEQPDTLSAVSEISTNVNKLEISSKDDTKTAKKEQLTKSQKRRQWERTDHKGDKPRGWDWVDAVKHLSQTGGKDTVPLS